MQAKVRWSKTKSPVVAATFVSLVAMLLGCAAMRQSKPKARGNGPMLGRDLPNQPAPPAWKPLPPRGAFLSVSEYTEPPSVVVDLLQREPEPTLVLHAGTSRFVRLFEQPLIPMSQLARPRLGLAGLRIDTDNRTQGTAPLFTRLVFEDLDEPNLPVQVPAPGGALLGGASFSPDGSTILVSLIYSDKTLAGLVDTTQGTIDILPTGDLSSVLMQPCSWVSPREVLCARPQFNGRPPRVELKPNIVELIDGAAATLTYSNLLRDSNDDLLLEHYGGVELFTYDLDTGTIVDLPGPGLITAASLAPNRRYLMTERLERPFPHLLPVERFPRHLIVFDVLTGEMVLHIGARDESISTATPWGPRAAAWDPTSPAKLAYVYRERRPGETDQESLIAREPPFETTHAVLARDLVNTKSWGFTSSGSLYLVDAKRAPRGWTSYRLGARGQEVMAEGRESEVIGDVSRALKIHGNRGAVLEASGKFYFLTEELSKSELYNRLSEWDPNTKVVRPLWRNLPTEHATVFAVLDPKDRDYLIQSETPNIPPYFLVSEAGKRRAVTSPAHAAPGLAGVTRQQIFYRRADSVLLSAMLYLPAEFKPGVRLPTVLWIYPTDVDNEKQASRLSVHPRRYFDVRGPSRFSLLTQGYALVDAPSMPIIGEVLSGRDDYLPQLVQSARACIDYLVELGISDPDNIAAMGRSYGASAVANLMAHTQLFKTGIAISGAYNRTLTPFGFQSETHTFWQNSAAYVNLSPFFFADQVQGSLLLLHGEDDDNPGTAAFQSERFYAALSGNGVKSRYVSFPFEGHQFRGDKTVFHATAEIINWLDRHLKPAAPR